VSDDERRTDAAPQAGGGAEGDPIADFLSSIWQEVKDRPVAVILPVAEQSDEGETTAETHEVAETGTPVRGPSASDVDLSAAPVAESAPVGGSARTEGISASTGVRSVPEASAGGNSANAGTRRLGDRSRRWFFLVGIALGVVAVLLVWLGVHIVLGSSDGRLVTRISDRSAVGFEAIVDKTPTDLVLMVGDGRVLESATLLALTSESVGGVMSVPTDTDVYVSPTPGAIVPITIRNLFAASGVEATSTKLGELLNLTFSHVDVLEEADLLERLGTIPLTVNNPSAVVDDRGATLFAKGSINLTPDQVWPFLAESASDEGTAAHAERVGAFWKAWLASMATSQSADESSGDGMDRYLTTLAASRVSYATLPVSEVAVPAGEPRQLRLAEGLTGPAAIASIVPFPEGAPGRRPRLRVIDGTGELDDGQGAAVILSAGGGQVDVIGNARAFGVDSTQIIYYEPEQREAAERMRTILGLGDVVQSTQTNSALDLTITLGRDYLERSDSTVTEATGG
jgi:LytR cell envelope-related transcriptional attenuator